MFSTTWTNWSAKIFKECAFAPKLSVSLCYFDENEKIRKGREKKCNFLREKAKRVLFFLSKIIIRKNLNETFFLGAQQKRRRDEKTTEGTGKNGKWDGASVGFNEPYGFIFSFETWVSNYLPENWVKKERNVNVAEQWLNRLRSELR